MKIWLVKVSQGGVTKLLTGHVTLALADKESLRLAETARNLGRDPGQPPNPRILAPDRKIDSSGLGYAVLKRRAPGKQWTEIVRYWAEEFEVHGDVISALGAQA